MAERPSKKPRIETEDLEILEEAEIPEAVGLVREIECENDDSDGIIIRPNPVIYTATS